VTVDQCQDCRGIFLDRGELEHLIDAEQGFSAPAAASAQPAAPAPQYAGAQYREQYGSAQHRDQHSGDYRKRKKRSFLEDLFD
jgi:Zn-finger nucleic acid-binding protein